MWIGLAEVKQHPGAGMMMDRNEAIVNVLALAADVTTFHSAIEAAFGEIGFDLVSLDESEPLQQRQEQFEVADDLLFLAREVGLDGVTRFGSFHTWTSIEGSDE